MKTEKDAKQFFKLFTYFWHGSLPVGQTGNLCTQVLGSWALTELLSVLLVLLPLLALTGIRAAAELLPLRNGSVACSHFKMLVLQYTPRPFPSTLL